jgi:hypothetical protein
MSNFKTYLEKMVMSQKKSAFVYWSQLSCVLLPLLLLLLVSQSSATLKSRQTKGTSWSGYVELTKYTRRITVHPYFLDVEEDIELAPYGYGWSVPPNNLNTLEIYGEFSLPAQSVITGILIWNGDSLLQGKLKGKENARAEYENVVDRNTAPPPRPRDPILIEKILTSGSLDQYRCSIFPVEWEKSRKIRIRYLSPQRYINNELVLQVAPSLAVEASEVPLSITQQISSYDNVDNIQIISMSDTMNYSLPVNFNENFNINKIKNTYIKISQNVNSMMVKTHFNDGNWKGNYVMYWGAPPESLLIKAGVRREIVFLWKWNFWHTFVFNENATKTLSPYGKEAINQARKILNTNRLITDAGDRVGLLLEKGTPALNRVFSISGKNTVTFDSLQAFLYSIDSTHLVTTINGVAPPPKIRIPEDERESFYSQSTQSFDISLKLICNLFSEHEKVIKHIVFISAGPVPEMPNIEDYYKGSD